MSQELHSYVQEQLAKGVDTRHLRDNLLKHGWDASSVDAALHSGSTPPPPPSPSAPPRPEMQTGAPGVHRKIIGILFGVLFVVLLGVGGVFAYNTFVTPSPKEVLQKMTVAMQQVHSSSFDTTFSYSSVGSILQSVMLATAEVTGDESTLQEKFPFLNTTPGTQASGLVTEFTVRLKGKSDYTDINESVADMTATLNVKTPIKYGPAEIAVRRLPSKTYIKATNLAPIMLFDLSALADQWIELNFDGISEAFLPVFPAGVDATAELGQSGLMAKSEQSPITKEQQQKLRQILFRPDLFVITDVLASENIHGVSTYHYAYTIDKAKATAALLDAQKFFEESYGNEQDDRLTEDEMKKVMSVGEKIIESISGEMWIGKKDFYLYKSTANVRLKGYGAEVSTDIVTESTDFNTSVTVEAPESFKTFEQAMQDLFGGLGDSLSQTYGGNEYDMSSSSFSFGSPVGGVGEDFSGGESGTTNTFGASYAESYPYVLTKTQIDSMSIAFGAGLYDVDDDVDGLSDGDEIFIYKTNPNSADSDGDGFADFEELEKGYNPNGEGRLVGSVVPPIRFQQ